MIEAIQNRTKQWWQPKAGNILALVYLSALQSSISLAEFSFFLPLSLVTIFGIGLFAHLLNDWADKTVDLKASKSNVFEKRGVGFFAFSTLVSLVFAIAPWFLLPANKFSIALLVTEFLLIVCYAFKPLRLKTKGVWGLMADALYAFAIPAVLAYHTFTLIGKGSACFYTYLFIAVWQFFSGIYNVAIHQFEDFENDVISGIETWVIKKGKRKARRATLLFFYLPQVVAFLIFAVWISISINRLYFILPFTVVTGSLIITLHRKNFNFLLQSPHTADFQRININYHDFLPYWHLALLSIQNPLFTVLLIVHFLLFKFNRCKWFFLKFVFPYFLATVFFVFKRIPSTLVNYTIFYYRMLVLRQSSAEARREYHAAHQENYNDYQKRLLLPNVVIANSNANKYTETFVGLHKQYITDNGFYLHEFYGGYLPKATMQKGALLPTQAWKQGIIDIKEAIWDLPKDYYFKLSIKEYFRCNNIRLVIAEFGLVGAELVSICKELNVPLMVIFYGYDAHHKKFIEAAREKYLSLFNYASLIIGVSLDIIEKLKELGANEHKLVYLPCAIDLDRFVYTDHSKNPPIFLCVGRFAETKSPHLTILAFNQVLKKIPNARLRMIGKDGGGELFEACHILVKALGIADKVDFLGIQPSYVVAEEMKKARIFVQHSVTTPLNGDKEGTPVAIMEAMACGLPVVSTHHAGIAELIDSGKTGFLVQEYDYLDMADKMIAVCTSDELVFSLGKNAAEAIRSNEFVMKNKQKFIDLINQCMIKD